MTPAQHLTEAIRHAERAFLGMDQAGVEITTLAGLQDALLALEHEQRTLPKEIHEAEERQCPHCALSVCSDQRLAVGDRHVIKDDGCECTTDDPYKCPRVAEGCGFRDPSDPLADVVDYRRQAL